MLRPTPPHAPESSWLRAPNAFECATIAWLARWRRNCSWVATGGRNLPRRLVGVRFRWSWPLSAAPQSRQARCNLALVAAIGRRVVDSIDAEIRLIDIAAFEIVCVLV